MSNSKRGMFLEVLLQLREKTRGIKGICYYEILLNLYFDLGGRLPINNKEKIKPGYFNKDELEEIFYTLLSQKITQMVEQEKFNEILLINMMVNRVTQLLEEGYRKILIAEKRKGAKGYRVSKTATVNDFRAGYEVQLWWEAKKEKIFKKRISVISVESDKLYYLLQAKEDYKFLQVN